MSGSQHLLLGAVPQVASDPNFEYTTLLLPGNGTNGAQNNTFLDSSTNNFTITRNGNTTQGTFSPFSQTGWGLYQPTSQSDYVNFTTGAGTLFQFTGDYTIEGWVFLPSIGSDTSVWITSPDSVFYHALNIDATNYNLYLNSGGVTASIAHGLTLNSWNHFAMVRSGSTITMYTNGTSRGTTTNSSTNGYASPILARIGGGAAGTNPRYLSNFRIVKGTAVYTANFTPPSTPLTAISGTSLLTASSNRFNDVAAAGSSPTITGSPSIQAFSPFNPTAAWSAATYGGSGYFDGSGDYLTVPDNAAFTVGSGNWTLEAWVYPLASPNQPIIIGQWSGGTDGSIAMMLSNDSNRYLRGLVYSGGYVDRTSTASLQLNAWNHCAFVREGTALNLYLNGARVDNYSFGSGSIQDSSLVYSIGASSSGSQPLNAYVANARLVVGTAVYTGTTYTVPTSPLTAITNTQLLCNFTNAGIYDATSKNDLETVGNAQISTTQSKFGGSSMYFDGSGDYLASAASPLLALGTGDLTVEFWFRASSVGTNQRIVQNTVGGFDSTSYILRINGSSKLEVAFAYPDVSASSSTTIANNTWYHVAMVRYGTSVKVYLNGIQEMSGTSSGNMSNQYAYVGGYYNVGPAEYFTGYVQDVRITKGIARYTSNFTPPTTAFLTL